MVSENSGDVRLEGTEGQDGTVGGLGGALKDGHRVTALPTRSSPDRTPQALMLTIWKGHSLSQWASLLIR